MKTLFLYCQALDASSGRKLGFAHLQLINDGFIWVCLKADTEELSRIPVTTPWVFSRDLPVNASSIQELERLQDNMANLGLKSVRTNAIRPNVMVTPT